MPLNRNDDGDADSLWAAADGKLDLSCRVPTILAAQIDRRTAKPTGFGRSQEPTIVTPAKRYHRLRGSIDPFENHAFQRVDIAADWILIKRIRGERP